ncbi:hypothetical protein CJF42_10195 [Pseudoalteromonas sp. NBT06-2]|uniref:CapA family protein n=1 Tax=Pseudoalteromonas sp. NBT06-2 TaxID=2025950 RepID=UPI000BA6E0D2|nr:CapA family protein [Pseudoalteromonas sp. NBT06-2]PAJ74474.1 hypothetical protein CJF42_10195 [Pseudoalteromonas sp. NBT06-2]
MIICFTGDLFLGGDLLTSCSNKIIQIKEFNEADFRVVNLEQAISDNSTEINKCTLYTDSTSLSHLVNMKVDAVNLAHNHIQDKGLMGIVETVENLDVVGVQSFGAGENIDKAKQPADIKSGIKIFGYCDFDRPYLKQIEVADIDRPGVNPLRLESIEKDLATLKNNEKAILYFHWGMEHINLPKVDEIKLAKTLLEDERVLTIMGMHSHRFQGVIKHNEKSAYMSLGNFLFPNFYIAPPTKLYYPGKNEDTKMYKKTFYYHDVYKKTYKVWKWINRVSIIVLFDTEKGTVTPVFVKQDPDKPYVKNITGVELILVKLWFNILSASLSMPLSIYRVLHVINVKYMKLFWRIGVWKFKVLQLGVKGAIKKIFKER